MPRTRCCLSILAVLIALAVAACSAPLDLPGWLIEVPSGTRIIELQAVPFDARGRDAVQLVDELVVGNDPENTDSLFYRPIGIVASADGRMFVADAGDLRILMFAPDGAYLGSFGSEGQGPAELAGIFDLAIVGERIVIEDLRNGRLSVWTVDGEHVADHPLAGRRALMSLAGLGGDRLASRFYDTDEGGRRFLVAAIHALSGAETTRILEIPVPQPVVVREGVGTRNSTVDLVRGSISTLGYPDVLTAVGSDEGEEVVYLSPAHEYQVLASTPEGGSLWALRASWARRERSVRERQRIVDRAVRSGNLTASVDDFAWPRARALEFLRADGHGRLHVFPTMPREDDASPVPRMVDIYSRDGELVAAGLVDHVWSHARDDFVYGLRTNDRDEQEAFRYRLVIEAR